MKNNYTVYFHRNKANGKYYVGITGSSVNKRWRKGKSYTQFVGDNYKHRKFAPAIKKYGWDGFDHVIVSTGLTLEDATKMEVELIKKYNSLEEGYNSTSGGEGTSEIKRDSEWRRKRSMAMKGRLAGSKNGSSRKIRCLETNEVFGSLSEACEKYNLNYSSFHANLNKSIKNGHICCGYHWAYAGPLKRKKITVTRNVNARKVRCVETGEVFNSAVEASKRKGLISAHITRSIKRNWTHGGYHWEYA